ncbi:hypothetical protein [Emticicia sp. W12TSBA100-4]|uniref:hypothetical protein n=1 Tax=Emticicia sp. W12TSBA100-4 TaxID=3160965 RepID=UPI00330565E5
MNFSTTSTLPPPSGMHVFKDNIPDLDAQEQELKQKMNEIAEQRQAAAAQAAIAEKKRLEGLRAKRKELLDKSRKYDEMSLKATTADDKILYADEALQAKQEAYEIVLPEDSQEAPVEIAEKPGVFEWILSSVGTGWFAMILFVALALLSYHNVFKIAEEINEINKIAQDTGNMSQMLPPSIGKMSFQKGWFNWMTISLDFLALILIMAVISPDKLYFLLPFTKNPVKAWKPFNNQSEEQKQWQSFAYVALILLFLCISHLGGK